MVRTYTYPAKAWPMRGPSLRAFWVSCPVLLLGAPLLAWLWLQLPFGGLNGWVRVRGERLPADLSMKDALMRHAKAYGASRLELVAGPYVASARRATLGAALQVTRAEQRMRGLGRSGNPFRDLGALLAGIQGKLELPWTPHVDRARLHVAVSRLRDQLERPPVAGTYDHKGTPIDGIAGLTINATDALSRIERALRDGAAEVSLPTHRIEPPLPNSFEEVSANAHLPVLLKSYETSYARRNLGRAQNIALSAMAIDGHVMLPGGTLSFNGSVGERSAARGFQPAKEIANLRVVDGIGGGVCQTAATLHAAAFLAGLEIQVYSPHSRPSRYIPAGLDTMVSWPTQDLVIRNPYPFPIRVSARAEDGVVQVALHGAAKAHPVTWEKREVERIPAGEAVVVDPTVAPGETRVVQAAIDGLVLRRKRTIYLPTGPLVTDDTIQYPPTPRIIATHGAR